MIPSDNYQDLLKQFNALKTLLSCKEREVNWFVKISINDYLNNKSKIETINFVSTNLI